MKSPLRILVYAAVPILYLLHQDWWNWDSRNLVLGLPVGLAYHAAFCVAASILMFCLVRFAWPAHLEVAAEEMHPEGEDAWH
jgi:hypothetical protein